MTDTARRIERGGVHMAADSQHRWFLVVSGAMFNSTGTVYVAPVTTHDGEGCVLAVSSFSFAVIDQLTKVNADELGDCVFRLDSRQQRVLDRIIRTIFLTNVEER